MKTVDNIKGHVERILSSPGQELGRWARFLRFQIRLWRVCATRLRENNVAAMSAALSFRTIFALVPAMVLALLVMKSVGVLEDGKRSLRSFLERSGFSQISVTQTEGDVPAEDAEEEERVVNVAEEFEAIVQRVEGKLSFSRIGPVGVVLLIWTALTLLTTMERSLNRVFGAERHRSLGKRLPFYWSVLTLGPLLYIAAAYVGQRAIQLAADLPGQSILLAAAGLLGPAVVGILVLAGVYKMLAHTDVPYRAAAGGALVAVPLWLLAKWAFAIYVTKLVGTGNLYGALGLLPLFLIWLNVSWMVFLFGAELANAAAGLNTVTATEAVERASLGPGDMLAAMVAVARIYLDARGPASSDQVSHQLQLPPDCVDHLLRRLASASLVCEVQHEEDTAYVLAKPPERIPVLAILGMDGDDSSSSPQRDYGTSVEQAVARTRKAAQSTLGTFTLADALAD